MRTSKYSEEQIIGFLRQAEAGMPVKEIGRKHGFSDASFYSIFKKVLTQLSLDSPFFRMFRSFRPLFGIGCQLLRMRFLSVMTGT